jgi:threonine dehydrogenase-like Zn-dependent dehydrogenase
MALRGARERTIHAMVATAPGKLELREFPRPAIGPDEAILRVQACGICGTDIAQFQGKLTRYPFIPGHEPVGVIDEIGEQAAARWRVGPGDRVAIEGLLACGSCINCLAGARTACLAAFSYGFTPLSRPPAVWGAYADYLYLHPRTVLHRISERLPAALAVMFNPIGAGVRWASRLPATRLGDSMAILGAGQRGLACLIVAKAVGAWPIIVTDVARAAHKLELARELGADYVITADRENSLARVAELTGNQGVDIVLDVNSDIRTVAAAVEMAKPGGTVVLAGAKPGEIPGLVADRLVLRSINLRGTFTVDTPSYREAVRLLEANAARFERLHTASYPMERAAEALHHLAGSGDRLPAIHLALECN